MGDVTPASLPPILLVLGDEELLATRAVAEAVARARAWTPRWTSGNTRPARWRSARSTRCSAPRCSAGAGCWCSAPGRTPARTWSAALLAYAKNPDPDVQLVVLHLGGGKGKAFADGLRSAGATVVSAAKLKGHRERVAFVRDEIRRHGGQVHRRRRRGPDRGGRQRPARAGRRLLPAHRRHRRADQRRDGLPLLPGPGRGDRLHRGRRDDGRRHPRRAGGAALGAARRGGPGAHRRRARRRRAYRGPGRLGRAGQRLPARQQPGHARVEDRAGPAAEPRLDAGGPGRGDAGGRRVQRGGQGRRRRPCVRAGAGRSSRWRRPGRAARR